MLSTSAALLIFSFLSMIIDSASSPAPGDSGITFDDTLSTDIFFENPSSKDYFTPSTEPTDLLDLDSTFNSDLTWDQENLFAENTGAEEESCRSENLLLTPAISRLRAREESDWIFAEGKTCEAQQQNSDENRDPFLELPKFFPPITPGVRPRRDICPFEEYEMRGIPVCSSGLLADEELILGELGERGVILHHARPCKLLLEFRDVPLSTVASV